MNATHYGIMSGPLPDSAWNLATYGHSCRFNYETVRKLNAICKLDPSFIYSGLFPPSFIQNPFLEGKLRETHFIPVHLKAVGGIKGIKRGKWENKRGKWGEKNEGSASFFWKFNIPQVRPLPFICQSILFSSCPVINDYTLSSLFSGHYIHERKTMKRGDTWHTNGVKIPLSHGSMRCQEIQIEFL